jgi:hypothetical protein
MGGTDSFNSSSQPKRGANPFGGQSYSDSFVRATTAPLGRRMTRPLQADPGMVESKLRGVEEQLGLCRAIIDRFGPRMRLLKAAETLVKSGPGAAPAPASPPPSPAPKPTLGKSPLAKKPLTRPVAPTGAAAANPALNGLSPQEKTMVAAMADRLREDADLLRRAQIAVFQFDDAQRSVEETDSRIAPIRGADPEVAWDLIEALEVSKLQGKVYPICNFHEIFKRDPVLSRVFPPPTPSAASAPGMPGFSGGTGPLGGASPGTGSPAFGQSPPAQPGTGPLGGADGRKGFFKR